MNGLFVSWVNYITLVFFMQGLRMPFRPAGGKVLRAAFHQAMPGKACRSSGQIAAIAMRSPSGYGVAII